MLGMPEAALDEEWMRAMRMMISMMVMMMIKIVVGEWVRDSDAGVTIMPEGMRNEGGCE
jgi:hypothetical protein